MAKNVCYKQFLDTLTRSCVNIWTLFFFSNNSMLKWDRESLIVPNNSELKGDHESLIVSINPELKGDHESLEKAVNDPQRMAFSMRHCHLLSTNYLIKEKSNWLKWL